MLYSRHKLLLAFLDSLGGTLENRDFQKLLLIYCTEFEKEPTYDFVPHRYGCFSFTSHADRRKLVLDGMLEDNADAWILTAAGREIAGQALVCRDNLSEFRLRNAIRGDALVARTYRCFPYYAINSKIVESLGLSAGEIEKIRDARPQHGTAGLLTIGYEGNNLEEYLNRLIRANVHALIDVRRNPLSRKYGFSKKVLAAACLAMGIEYEHVPELGIASDRRKGLKSFSDYQKLFAAYEIDTLPHRKNELRAILGRIQSGQRVALTCFEHAHGSCHRSCVSKALTDLSPSLSGVEHL